jgi:hypothetical protein
MHKWLGDSNWTVGAEEDGRSFYASAMIPFAQVLEGVLCVLLMLILYDSSESFGLGVGTHFEIHVNRSIYATYISRNERP